jgi:ATP-dependent Clp protease protease subunit
MALPISETIPAPLKRDLFFSKEVNQASVQDLTENILAINENDKTLKKIYPIHGIEYTPKPIRIIIDSYGGEVYTYLGLIGVIDNSKTPIHTIVTGSAMSAAFTIAICGHKRFCHNYSTFMYHQSWDIIGGPVKSLMENIEELKRLEDLDKEIILKRTKIKEGRIKEIFEKKIDWFISPKEAVKLGLVDEII